MKRIIILILSIFCLFLSGCSYQVLNPNNDSSSNSSNNNGNSGNNNGNNNSGTTKTMYFKFKVSGKSSLNKFKYGNEHIYPKEVSIENYQNKKTFSYTGKWGDPGFITIFYFCDDKIGNSMSIPFYIGDSKLSVVYDDKSNEITYNGYIWILNSGKGFFRNDFSCTIPLKDFDESKNNNTALISIVLYPDSDSYICTFDGFESK
ncbi:hypothetical secreted protein [Brachyspira suanatina]|uniref:Hypothetical secreted protein n=1 Tax=Brachyspira suanatina TaxID=381802 RepID=A0A0G4K480_9SPIR|nr:hypothetical protein [Brachyspira suanatina]CRF31483.1 hypothetical secreted protein [Brachyspira suanatina]